MSKSVGSGEDTTTELVESTEMIITMQQMITSDVKILLLINSRSRCKYIEKLPDIKNGLSADAHFPSLVFHWTSSSNIYSSSSSSSLSIVVSAMRSKSRCPPMRSS
jgi:hypothetical protein